MAKFEKFVRDSRFELILQNATSRNFFLLAQGQVDESLSDNVSQLYSDQKKAFKRFCKLLVTNLVDMFPQRKDVLPNLVGRVVGLAGSKQRLVRLSFTHVAIMLMKNLLENLRECQLVYERLESSQTQQAEEKAAIASDCLVLLKLVVREIIDKVVRKRICDPQEWTRRLVLEGLAGLDFNELRIALQLDSSLLEIVVDALRDVKDVQKAALSLLQNILHRYRQDDSSNLKVEIWQKLFLRSKLQLIKLCRVQETQVSLKAI